MPNRVPMTLTRTISNGYEPFNSTRTGGVSNQPPSGKCIASGDVDVCLAAHMTTPSALQSTYQRMRLPHLHIIAQVSNSSTSLNGRGQCSGALPITAEQSGDERKASRLRPTIQSGAHGDARMSETEALLLQHTLSIHCCRPVKHAPGPTLAVAACLCAGLELKTPHRHARVANGGKSIFDVLGTLAVM